MEKKTVKENDRVVVIDNDLVRAMECVIKAGHESVLFAPRQGFGGVVLLSMALQVTPSKDRKAFVDKWLDYQDGWGKLGNVMDFPLSIDCLSFTKSQTKRFMHLLSAIVIEELSQSSPAAPSNAFKIFKNLLDNIDQVQVFDDKESVKEWLSEIQLLLKNLSYEKTSDRNYYHHSTPSSKSRWRQMQTNVCLNSPQDGFQTPPREPARKMQDRRLATFLVF